MRAQIQANIGNFGLQRFSLSSLHGVGLTKIDVGGARDEEEVIPWTAQDSRTEPALCACRCLQRCEVLPDSAMWLVLGFLLAIAVFVVVIISLLFCCMVVYDNSGERGEQLRADFKHRRSKVLQSRRTESKKVR